MSSDVRNEVARQMVQRAALIATTNTPGWSYVRQLADKLVADATQEALDAEDPIKGESKRLKAAALKKGFNELFNSIESYKQYTSNVEADDSGFGLLEQPDVPEEA